MISELAGRGATWTEEQGTSESKGRGDAWTEERGTSDEGRRRSEGGMGRWAGPRHASGQQSTSEPEGRLKAPRRRAGGTT